MDIIILAAGKASRVGSVAKNIQKCMISFDGATGIDYLLSKLPKADKIIVVVSDDIRGEILQRYLYDRYGSVFTFVKQPKPVGTANAVYIGMLEAESDDILVSWSDIIPKHDIKVPSGPAIFTTNDFSCRYRFDGRSIDKTEGNIFGMFFVKKSEVLPLLEDSEADFVDILKESGIEFEDVPVECYDFGTLSTLKETRENLSTSAHADIILHQKVIIKEYNSQELFHKELMWYKFAPQKVQRFIPKLLNSDPDKLTLTLERINGTNPDYLSEDYMKDFLARLVFIFDEYLHSSKYPSDEESLRIEYVGKVIERTKTIVNTVPGLSNDYILINGESYNNPINLLCSVAEELVDELKPETFSFIHGDPTLQNIIVTSKKDIKLLDPRSKFGTTWLYGDKKYDYAKLYYSFVGNYDGFNAGECSLDIKEGSFNYWIKPSRFSVLGDWYLDYAKKVASVNPIHIKIIHALIWLRVVGYVLPQNFELAVIAYLNGTVLLDRALLECDFVERN